MRTCLGSASEPVTDISEVGQGGTQSDDSNCFPTRGKNIKDVVQCDVL